MEENRDWIEQVYSKNLNINRKLLQDEDSDLHDYILRGLAGLDSTDLNYIFGIREPSRLLSEGEEIHGNTTVEDFAVTGSYNGGEMAIGQVVSTNGKELIGSRPKDYRQINRFGDEIEDNPEIDPEITGYYLVRSDYEPEEVRSRNKYFKRDFDFFGAANIPVDIYRVEPEENNIEKALRSFYSSL